jgi:dipeptidyl aminopeptidase/acylaminoacyl peptidase
MNFEDGHDEWDHRNSKEIMESGESRMTEKKIAPFGTWESPISPQMLGLGTRLEDVQWAPSGELLWLEGRSGRGVLVFKAGDDAPRDLTDVHSVEGGVGYGGGEFTAGDGFAVFAEKDGRLYRVDFNGGKPHPITPAFGAAAAPVLSPDGKWLLYVHSYEKTDRLAVVDVDGRRWPSILAQGADFYMQPVWQPGGRRIAWVEWNHPNMPWDGTLLRTARFDPEGCAIADARSLAGGPDVSVFQPTFSPDGRRIACIVGEGEWDSLLLIDPESGAREVLVDGLTLAEPAWAQGMRTYGWMQDGKSILYRRNDGGWMSLWSVDVQTHTQTKLDISPYTWMAQPSCAPKSGRMACLASAPTIPTRVIMWDLGRMITVARSSGERVPPEAVASPQELSWRVADGTDAHGLYFPPCHPGYEGKGLPPAILCIHGGPTAQWEAAFSSDVAFFTSRGYACLLVNYRGSTGYGRAYERALRGGWGDLDVADAVGGAKALCERGLADPARLVIKGGSAGGYTVLNALIRHPGLFRAGVCLYGVSNLFTLAADTHKFEARYLDRLVGPLPEAGPKYREWSPVFHADSICDPLAVFQGSDDRVVPPAQSEEIVDALRRGGVPHLYKVYAGEGHGWRKAETIASYYTELEKFLNQHVLFA